MPNRYIRESAIESEAINSLSWHGEVFYRRLLNRADDFGRFTANTALLRAKLFPLQLDKVSVKDIERLLEECETAGLLFRYITEQSKVLLVLNKWETGRAKKSEYADPPAEITERMQTYVYTPKHMSPTPIPTPIPTPPPSSAGAQGEKQRGDLPTSLKTPAMTEAWERWLVHWSTSFAHGRPMTEQTAHAQLRKLTTIGPDRAITAINNAITRGLREPAEPFESKGPNANNRTGNSRSFSQQQDYSGVTDK